MTQPVIGVFPRTQRADRQRLFDALELAFRVRFQGRDPNSLAGLAAAVFIGSSPAESLPFPWVAFAQERSIPASARTRIGTDAMIDARLRGRALTDGSGGCAIPLGAPSGSSVLAATGAGPVWLALREHPWQYLAAIAPAELEAGEPLRARLRAGSFLPLLPLVHLLREIDGGRQWDQPRQRAAFIIDDPNLHGLSYGYIDYRELVARAKRGGYHVAIASTPLDYRFVHPQARALFRGHPAQISLTVHGNDHEHGELSRVLDAETALSLGAQALRRAHRLERHSGLSVSRVMNAPHEECNEVMLSALYRLGFDGLARDLLAPVSRPGAKPAGVLADWEPAEILGGLAILPRFGLQSDAEDFAWRAYLNLPMLICLHHTELAGGLDVLDRAADLVNRLRPTRWMSLSDVCASNVAVARSGSSLLVRPYARRVRVAVEPTATEIIIDTPPSDPAVDVRVTCGPAAEVGTFGSRFRFAGPFSGVVAIEMGAPDPVDVDAVPARATRIWPVLRRMMTEGRDRLAPLPDRIRAGRAAL